MTTRKNCGHCGKDLGESEGGLLCVDCLRKQRHLDFLWLITIGGVGGELLGMYLGRKFLSVELLYLCIAAGMLLSALIAKKWLQKLPVAFAKLSVVFSTFIRKFFYRQPLTIDEVAALLKNYTTHRRWIACENVIRRYVAGYGKTFTSPNLARRVLSISQGFAYCKNQIVFLTWYIIGGVLFTFISFRLEVLKNDFPELIGKTITFLPRFNDFTTVGVAAVIWFILLSFVLSVILLTLGRTLPKKGFGWAIFGCFGLMAFPLLKYGLDTLSGAEFLRESQQIGDLIRNYLIPYLPVGSMVFILYAKTGFLHAFWQSPLKTTGNENIQTLPPLFLFGCVLLLDQCRDMALLQYLPESLCFLFLLAATGGLYQFQPDVKQPRWLLIPCGGIVISVLNAQLENVWAIMLSVGTTLLIAGFLVSPKKNLATLWSMVKLLFFVVIICQCIRWYCGDAAKAVLTLMAIWSAVGAWYVCSKLVQFDATLTVADMLQKMRLRRRYRNTDFAKDSIMETEWYQNQQITPASPQTKPVQQTVPVPRSVPVPPIKR